MKIRYLALLFLFIASNVQADVSLSLTDVTFSIDEPVEGERVRVFARVYNYGTEDVFGLVKFQDIGEPQVISIRPNTFDDVFVDWVPEYGNHNISVKVIIDEEALNLDKPIFIDKDTDTDGIGDLKDNDNDNDGLSDEQEEITGTSPILSDTDNDGINDKNDVFPLDSSESSDNDSDGMGDNQDLDDDNDGLLDQDEIIFYDTNPLSSDTDNDKVLDGVEISQETDPKNPDTDGDGVDDFEDQFPLDPDKSYASVFDNMKNYLSKIGTPSLRILGFVLLALVILLMVLIKRH